MRFLLTAAAVTVALGLVALAVAAIRSTWVDSAGMLHEPFAWMATGRMLLVAAAVLLLCAGAAWAIGKVRG